MPYAPVDSTPTGPLLGPLGYPIANPAASAVAAAGSAALAAGSATSASAAASAAQAAQAAAQLSAGVYANTTAGLAGTTTGHYFSIPSASAGGYLDLYLNSAGAAQLVNTYPSLTGVLAGRVVGEIISGSIYPVQGVDANHFSFVVTAGTKVRASVQTPVGYGPFTQDPIIISLTAGTFPLIDISVSNAYYFILLTNRAGTLSVVSSNTTAPPVVPSSEYVALAYSDTVSTTGNVNMLPYRPTVNFQSGQLAQPLTRSPPDRREFNFATDFGGVGDGVTSNLAALQAVSAYLSSLGTPFTSRVIVRVPPGTYMLPPGTLAGVAAQTVLFIGSDRTTTTFKSSDLTQVTKFPFANAEGITFYNVSQAASSQPDFVRFKHCAFRLDASIPNATALYWLNASPAAGGSVEIEDNTFDNGTMDYVTVWISGARNVLVRNNRLTGDASHVIRVDAPVQGGRIEITGNQLAPGAAGFTTGIFVGSNRTAPIERLLVKGNQVSGYTQEGISLDGFGNNEGLVPTICNGTITSASNDVNGRLVITPSMVYVTGGVSTACPISLRTDWTTFYATLGQGAGSAAGTVAKINSYNSVAGTLTLDVFTPAASVTAGGDFGVQAGFFSPVVRNNVLTAGYGAGNNSAVGISLWLNVFSGLIENNTIYGGANGLLLSGGLMLSAYYTLAWHNVVRANHFIQTNRVVVAQGQGGAIRVLSAYGGHLQYGNAFEGNEFIGGTAYLEYQSSLRWGENVMQDASLVFVHCGNTLPTADASQLGRRFMLITDDVNGNPTAISYWMVKLSGGVYSWVAAP